MQPQNINQQPQQNQPQPAPPTNSGFPASWLPTQNKEALIGYYLSIVGLLPFIGFPFAIAAVILGITGLKKEKQAHVPGAKAHALVALVLGGLAIICMLIFVVFMVSLNKK